MAIGNWETINRPNRQNDNPANEHALVIPEFTGIVEGTLARKSVVEPWIPMRKVTGTAVVTTTQWVNLHWAKSSRVRHLNPR